MGSEPEEGPEAVERGPAHPHSIYELMKDRIHNMRERIGSMFHHRGRGKGKRFHQKMMVGQPEWVQNMPEVIAVNTSIADILTHEHSSHYSDDY